MHLLLGHEFREGRLVAAILLDCNVGKTLCSVSLCKLNQRVDLLTRHMALSLSVDTANGAAVFQSALEYNELAVFDYIRDIL